MRMNSMIPLPEGLRREGVKESKERSPLHNDRTVILIGCCTHDDWRTEYIQFVTDQYIHAVTLRVAGRSSSLFAVGEHSATRPNGIHPYSIMMMVNHHANGGSHRALDGCTAGTTCPIS